MIVALWGQRYNLNVTETLTINELRGVLTMGNSIITTGKVLRQIVIGFQLLTSGELFNFALMHEAIHLGIISSQLKTMQ